MNKKGLVALVNIIFFSFIFFTVVNAQDMGDLTLSITPPLIKNNVSPGQVWRSAIKVVNNNAVAVEVYTEVVDFRSNNENGKVEFIRDQGQLDLYKNHLLSQWVDIDSGPYSITPGQSADIPFTVVVPETADPGGHYAAILVGTKPPVETGGGSSIKVSSQLASLILLRINGEEKEEGKIREFSTSEKFYFNPDIDKFSRFTVIFRGQFLPESGVEYAIKAAKILEANIDIKFKILGSGQEFGKVKKLAEGLKINNFEFLPRVEYKELPQFIASLDVCLGIFGQTLKTQRVIPNKIYEAIAMAKPVITAETPAIRELFTNKEDILLCRASDPEDLAAKILQLKSDSIMREKIAQNGYRLFESQCRPRHIVERLLLSLNI